MEEILKSINKIVWGAPALVLILGTGIFLSIRTGFVQLTLLPEAMRRFFRRLKSRNSGKEGVSSFEAMCTALAATVGIGNLAGVAGAIAIGGPGAVFWIWVSGILGMATKYAEAALAVRYRIREGKEYIGGPMYIIRQGMGEKWHFLAVMYSFFGITAAFGVGNATQMNAVIGGIGQAASGLGWEITPAGNWTAGIAIAAVLTAILLGGAKKIGRAAEKLVPFAAAAYLLLGIGVLIAGAERIPAALCEIFRGAFCPRAITGGAVGSAFAALRVGTARGVFTNEAGMGTAAIAHAGAEVSHPAEQGLMGIMEVFIDTVVICTVTALVILVSGVEIPYGSEAGVRLTVRAFEQTYGQWAAVLVAGAVCCFGIATVLGWGLYGLRCAQFLFGSGVWKKFAIFQGIIMVLSTGVQADLIWSVSETVNGLMAIPNLLALLALSGEVKKLTRDYKELSGTAARRKILRLDSIPAASGPETEKSP